jgi:hypothetical protein
VRVRDQKFRDFCYPENPPGGIHCTSRVFWGWFDGSAGSCLAVSICAAAIFGAIAAADAKEGFVTATFGNAPHVQYPATLKVEKDRIRFDLSSLPGNAVVQRAVLRFPFRSDWGGHSATKLLAVGLSDRRLPTRPPYHRSLDATDAVRAWAEDAATNLGLRILHSGRADFTTAVLEVSYIGEVVQPLPKVTQLHANHRAGQTFLTWREPFDVVGKDGPTFEEFERAIVEAQSNRRITYRVYRHTQPITAANLGQAELACEVPEALSSWNLLAIANTEHPQAAVTKRSQLRGGNLRLKHIMSRYRLTRLATVW